MADDRDSKADKGPAQQDIPSVLQSAGPEEAAEIHGVLAALGRKEKKSEGKKSFWGMISSLFTDEEFGQRARLYRQWYAGLDPRIIEVLDKHHGQLMDVESVKNWLTMSEKARIDRAKLSFENSTDRSCTQFLKDWSNEIDGSGVREESEQDQRLRAQRESQVQARKQALAQARQNSRTRRQLRPLWSRLFWPF
jgi:hypothetical protein